MRFLRFSVNDEVFFGCLKSDECIVDLNSLMGDSGKLGIKEMEEVIGLTTEQMLELEEKLEKWDKETYALKEVKVLTPIPFPKRNIFCLGKNYLEHAKELEGKTANLSGTPEYPIYFSKTASPSIGQGDLISIHSEITHDAVDYEVELAVIIGKEGVDIPKEDVESYIFGYTILNDISARDLQVRHTQWFRGKCLDTHCPMGPTIVYKKELPMPLSLDLKCYINDELRQSGNTNQMIFDIPTIISDLSRGTRLYPGDIIATGTPAGVGMGFNPPKYLKKGDRVECVIEKIGSLVNLVSYE